MDSFLQAKLLNEAGTVFSSSDRLIFVAYYLLQQTGSIKPGAP